MQGFARGLVIALALWAAGCGSIPITEANAPEIFKEFSTGNLRLGKGIIVIANSFHLAEQMRDATQKRDWSELAKVVIQANVSDDIGYYYLGMAAEGLGYRNAAAVYYALSIQITRDHIALTKCVPEGPGRYTDHFYFSAICDGIELPRDANARLIKLQKMR